MHYRVRKAIKKGRKWSYLYCKYRFKSIPKIGDKEFDDFVKLCGDGSYTILDNQSNYIGSIKVDKLGYRRRANKRGQIIKPSKFPSKHQRVPECADCFKKGFNSGVKKTRKRAQKVIQKRNTEIIQLKKQLRIMLKSQSSHTPIHSQMKAENQISEIKEKKLSKRIAEEDHDRDDFKEVEEEDVEIIECPSCGARVSIKDPCCPRCGFDPEEEDEEEDVEIIECPSCGGRVGAKDPCCPRCGFDPEEEDVEIIECPSCGGRVGAKDPCCPNCGFDPEEEENEEYEEKDEKIYLCPSCGAKVTAEDIQCPKCGFDPDEENESDLYGDVNDG